VRCPEKSLSSRGQWGSRANRQRSVPQQRSARWRPVVFPDVSPIINPLLFFAPPPAHNNLADVAESCSAITGPGHTAHSQFPQRMVKGQPVVETFGGWRRRLDGAVALGSPEPGPWTWAAPGRFNARRFRRRRTTNPRPPAACAIVTSRCVAPNGRVSDAAQGRGGRMIPRRVRRQRTALNRRSTPYGRAPTGPAIATLTKMRRKSQYRRRSADSIVRLARLPARRKCRR